LDERSQRQERRAVFAGERCFGPVFYMLADASDEHCDFRIDISCHLVLARGSGRVRTARAPR
jgi:hypothetical protein